MDWRTWLLLLCMSYSCSGFPVAPEESYNVDNYTIFRCPDGHSYREGTQVKMCPTGVCDEQGEVCYLEDPSPVICTSPHPYLPDNATNFEVTVRKRYYATYSNCPVGTKWASGQVEPYLSTCSNNLWSPFYDFCVEIGNEILPSDCSELIPLGINETKWYHVYALGLAENAPTLVFCEFAEDGNLGNSGWTTIFFRINPDNPGNSTDFAAEDTGSLFNDALINTGDFYTGIEKLYMLHKDISGASRSLVYQFLMISEIGFQHATYDQVNINKEDYFILEEVGNYHGNAGDAFRHNMGKNYQNSEVDAWFGWFIDAPTTDKMTYMTNEILKWGEMVQPNLLRAQIRVRPMEYDNENSCPLLVPLPSPGTNDSWTGTDVMVSQYRGPGSTITYSCTEVYLKEGVEGQARTSQGTVTCVSQETGRPAWDTSFVLPCTLVCQDGYMKLGSPTKCYKVSSEGHPLGYFGAARSCAKDGATLAANPDAILLFNNSLMGAGYHYTAHAKRGPAQNVTPEINFNCSGVCLLTPENECITVNEMDQWASQSCYNIDLKYICVIPGVCPNGYVMHKGRCLKFYDNLVNIVGALQLCQADGAALIVPETMEDLQLKMQFLATAFDIREEIPFSAFVGINKVLGDWTIGNHYTPDYEVVEYFEQPSQMSQDLWRSVTVENLTAGSQGVGLYDTLRYTLCEYPAPVGCWEDPPLPPFDHMQLDYDGSRWVETKAIYRCDEGYYIDEEQLVPEQTLLCYGLLGGWLAQPALEECLPSKCSLAPPIPLLNMHYEVAVPETLSSVGDFFSYTCDPGYVVNGTTYLNQTIQCYGKEKGWLVDELLACLPTACLEEPPMPLENMNYIFNASSVLGDMAIYRCDPGYFINETLNLTEQQIQCYGSLGGWEVDTIFPCQAMDVCLEALPTLGQGLASILMYGAYKQIGGLVDYTCMFNMTTDSGVSTQKVICSHQELTNGTFVYNFQPSILEDCKVCTGEPIMENATSNWSDQANWAIGEVVVTTCFNGYEVAPSTSTSTISCTAGGWLIPAGCYPACQDDPPPESDTMKRTTAIDNRIGAVLTYQCNANTYMPNEQVLPVILNSSQVTCGSDAIWELENTNMSCVTMCLEEPQVENATANWDDRRLYLLDSKIEINCTGHQEFELGQTTKYITCIQANGWETTQGCHPVCPSVPPEGVNMTVPALTSNAVGTVIEYSCVDDLKVRLVKEGQEISTTISVTCGGDLAWVPETLLVCEEVCLDGPAFIIDDAIKEDSEGPYWIGKTVNYTCNEHLASASGNPSTVANYTENGWQLMEPDFGCFEVTYVPPSNIPSGVFLGSFHPPYHRNETYEPRCETGRISNTGQTTATFILTDAGWYLLEPDFECIIGKPF